MDQELVIDRLACEQQSPPQQLAAREWSQRVRTEIESLPPRYRRPLTLFHLDGLSVRQVAEHLEVPAGTATSLLTRARRKLRDQFPSDLKEIPDVIQQVFDDQNPPTGLLAVSSHERLHIMNGDAAADRLRASGLRERVTVWTDILHEGPTPFDVSPGEWRRVRADHLRSMGFGDPQGLRDRMARADADIANPNDGIERVLWFEHDLYDQLLLIRHLHWLSMHEPRHRPSFSLVCIGEFPGITRFVGLGQLAPDQIVSLLDTRLPIEQAHVDLGADAWSAYCHSDPTKIAAYLAKDTTALLYLRAAITRHLQQFPSCFNGLGLSEQLILESAHRQQKTAGELFASHHSYETAPFLGDATFYHYVKRLADESVPSIRLVGPADEVTSETEVEITETGCRLLAGELDRIQVNGIDRWFGGVRLTGQGPIWRWDAEAQAVVYR